MTKSATKEFLADILSVVAATVQKEGTRDSLKYRLEATANHVTTWGQEYIRNITKEITSAYHEAMQNETSTTELIGLVSEIVPHNMKHNAEAEAVDLLSEVDLVEELVGYAEQDNYKRVVNYLISLANFAGSLDERTKLLKACYDISIKLKCFPEALRMALKLNDANLVAEVVKHPNITQIAKKQCAYLIHRHRFPYDFEDEESLQVIASGEHLSAHYQTLAKDVDVVEAKLPEDIYKSHLEEKRTTTVLDSAKANLASTFVNAFVNAGFCNDKLMTVEGAAWLYKNKDHGMMSATASLGPLLLWDVDDGLTQIDKFQWSNDENIKAGALLAFGLVTSGVKNECDPAWALLSEPLESESTLQKLGAIVGLGFAYGGQVREELLENLTPIVLDTNTTLECSVMAAVSLGLINVATANANVAEVIVLTLMERQQLPNHLDNPLCAFFAVGLGLLFLGRQEECEKVLEMLDGVTHPLGKYAKMTVTGCAYAGTGDVLKVQEMLQTCSEHIADEKEAAFQSVAVIGIGLIALGEEIGSEMVLRSMNHLLQYGEGPLRRAVPLCLGLMFASNPKVTVVDLFSKLSHDADSDVAIGAIFGMGLMGAGSNHARMAGLLRQLAGFYAKNADALFMVRIAQGMLYMGKGLMSLSPLHSDRFLINPVSLASLVVILHSCLHLKATFLGKHHYLLYHLVPAMHARMLMTLDEEGNVLPVTVRVGQAIDVTGQAGKPRNITGFQTHTTPVLLGYGERAELATDDYVAETSILEGFVILRKKVKDVEMAEGPAAAK
eukprot:GEMP01005296.1.p1 GENE.GEMP01005296.1~~GEMP01005296.1.p1  ORF type:complete len:899 (+),score=229.92 GEMP01005296.1:349-2697(+)